MSTTEPTVDPTPASTNGTNGHSPLPSPTPEPRRPLRSPLVLLLALLMGFAGGIGGVIAADLLDSTVTVDTKGDTIDPGDNAKPSNDNPGAASDNGGKNTGPLLTPREIYRNASPAVVHVTARLRVTDTSIFGIPQTREGVSTGSGYVIDKQGHIVTNAHVIENAVEVKVSFSDETELDAKVVGSDVSTDTAVLKVDVKKDALKNALKPLPFGDSAQAQVGDPVVAIGNPYSLDRTLTTGVVSALQREIQAPNGLAIEDVIQTDAAVNPGNSGGPLLNMRGQVIGTNSQIASESGAFAGIAFAVPASTVQRVADQLIKDGVVKHAWLGVTGLGITPELNEFLKLPTDQGVIINEVTKGSPADKAGLEGGDQSVVFGGAELHLGGHIITKVDGREMKSMRELVDYINGREPGDKVEIEYYDGDERKTTTAKLVTRPDQIDEAPR